MKVFNIQSPFPQERFYIYTILKILHKNINRFMIGGNKRSHVLTQTYN